MMSNRTRGNRCLHSIDAASKGQAFQMRHVSSKTEHRWWSSRPYPTSTQTGARKVIYRFLLLWPTSILTIHLRSESLPRIENALPGRDGYEVEIFGMEGIPAPDVADYKRRKEVELGLAAGSISQPQVKKPKFENRPLSEEELRAQLEAHKSLMGGAEPAPPPAPSGAVFGAPPQTYAAPPAPAPNIPPAAVPPAALPPPGFQGAPPFIPPVPPPGAFPGQLHFPPPPGMPAFPPG
jgi:hypothetical protein